MYAHCFTVYIRKYKLMINICDVIAQMLSTEVWKIGDDARKKKGSPETAVLWYYIGCAFLQ